MTVEGYLYYLPSFITLLIENLNNYDDRIGDLGGSLIGTLRSHPPYPGPIAKWVSYVREPSLSKEFEPDVAEFMMDLLGEQLEEWFVSKTSPIRCENIAYMTEEERNIVAQFLDELVLHPDFVDDENQIQSIQSILLNETSYSKRLGAKCESDIVDLLDLLNVTAQQFPTRFSPDIVASIAQKLKSEMG